MKHISGVKQYYSIIVLVVILSVHFVVSCDDDSSSTDSEAPETWIISGPNGFTNRSDIAFIFIGNDNETETENLYYSYALDDDEWSGFTAETEMEYFGLSVGFHEFYVRSQDLAGNIDATPAYRGFFIEPG